MASNVDIAEDVRFKFQIIQAVLNHVAYADNANQLAVAKHRHVAHAFNYFFGYNFRDRIGADSLRRSYRSEQP